MKGQSAAVAAQYMLSGQQNQLASGQQPAGHEVSPDPHCLLLANFMSWAFLATKGQSAAVAAQYMLSGQQNQLASGQQPAGHEVSPDPHCLLLAIFMSWAFLATKGGRQQWQHSTCCQGSRTSWPQGSSQLGMRSLQIRTACSWQRSPQCTSVRALSRRCRFFCHATDKRTTS